MFEEPVSRSLERHRLEDDARDVVGDRVIQPFVIIVPERERQVTRAQRNTGGAIGHADRPIVPTVVAAGEHRFASGKRTRDPHRRRRCLGTRLGKAHGLGVRHDEPQRLGHLDLEGMHQREGDSVFELMTDRGVDRRLRISEHERPDGHVHVEILVAVDIPDVGASSAMEVLGSDAAHVCALVLFASVWVPAGINPCARFQSRDWIP